MLLSALPSPPPPKHTHKKIPALVCSSVIFFFLIFFSATVRFQDDPTMYLLDLRGVFRGGIPPLPQKQQFMVS